MAKMMVPHISQKFEKQHPTVSKSEKNFNLQSEDECFN